MNPGIIPFIRPRLFITGLKGRSPFNPMLFSPSLAQGEPKTTQDESPQETY